LIMNMFDNILMIEKLNVGYGDSHISGKLVFSGINLRAKKGENIAVIGRNGIGKSTLLRTIGRLQKPLGGQIQIMGRDIRHYTRQEFARLISFVSTEIIRISNLRLLDLVAMGRYPYTGWTGKLDDNDHNIINDSIHLAGIDNLKYKSINEVSDGERQRAMIARALAQDTEIIILDEPTAFLDLPSKYEIIRLLNELSANKGKTIIFSSHDLSITLQETDKIWLMQNNKITEGAPEDLILNKDIYSLFDNSHLTFNLESGDIRLTRKRIDKINLKGKGTLKYWTRKALERMGYDICDEADADISVRINDDNKVTEWILVKKGNEIKCNSIYNLSLHLRNINRFY
jgi:iron complex transport system ATP-binding protein